MMIYFPRFGTNGFANTLFQYLFVKYIERILCLPVILGGPSPETALFPYQLFNLFNKNETPKIDAECLKRNFLIFKDRRTSPRQDILAIKNHLEDSQDNIVVIDGYFQYDTSLIFADSDYSAAFQENFSLNYKNNNFQSSLNNYSQKIKLALANSYLVAIHLRRGDYLNSIHRTDWVKDVFYPMNIDPIIKDLNHYLRINKITNSVIYVATDDPQFCEEYFRKKGIIILTAHDIFKDLDQDDENEKLLFDIAVLASAQMLIASNSSLSLFASLLNETASIFWRQTKDGETVSFDPRATSILYGL